MLFTIFIRMKSRCLTLCLFFSKAYKTFLIVNKYCFFRFVKIDCFIRLKEKEETRSRTTSVIFLIRRELQKKSSLVKSDEHPRQFKSRRNLSFFFSSKIINRKLYLIHCFDLKFSFYSYLNNESFLRFYSIFLFSRQNR